MGENGWHPHNHILLFTQHAVHGFASYRDQLASIWMDSCIKAGLRSPSMKHGLDIQDGSQADRYVAKWGLPEEMSKGHMKKGKNGGYTLSICWSYLLKISPYTVVNCLLNYFKNTQL